MLTAFRRGHVQTLLATNVAARGLDIQGIYQVINYELPESSELFTHRIGRTGRMGRQGKAITLLAPSDVSKWRRMSHSLGQAVSLQRLTINDAATLVQTPVKPAAPVMPERDSYDEQRPARGRKPFSADQDQESWSTRGRRPAARVFEQAGEARPERSRKAFSPDLERDNYDEQRPARGPKPFSADQDQEPYREQWPARTRKPARLSKSVVSLPRQQPKVGQLSGQEGADPSEPRAVVPRVLRLAVHQKVSPRRSAPIPRPGIAGQAADRPASAANAMIIHL